MIQKLMNIFSSGDKLNAKDAIRNTPLVHINDNVVKEGGTVKEDNLPPLRGRIRNIPRYLKDDGERRWGYMEYVWEGNIEFRSAYNYILLHLHKKKVGSIKMGYMIDLYNRFCGEYDKIKTYFCHSKEGVNRNLMCSNINWLLNTYVLDRLNMKPIALFDFGEDYKPIIRNGFELTDNFNTELMNIISETLVEMSTLEIRARYNLLMGNMVTMDEVMKTARIK